MRADAEQRLRARRMPGRSRAVQARGRSAGARTRPPMRRQTGIVGRTRDRPIMMQEGIDHRRQPLLRHRLIGDHGLAAQVARRSRRADHRSLRAAAGAADCTAGTRRISARPGAIPGARRRAGIARHEHDGACGRVDERRFRFGGRQPPRARRRDHPRRDAGTSRRAACPGAACAGAGRWTARFVPRVAHQVIAADTLDGEHGTRAQQLECALERARRARARRCRRARAARAADRSAGRRSAPRGSAGRADRDTRARSPRTERTCASVVFGRSYGRRSMSV